MGEDDDRRLVVRLHVGERVLRPNGEDLIGARQPLLRRELAPRVGDDRVPAEQLGRGAEGLRRVHGPDHEQPRGRAVDLREDLAAVVELEHAVPAGTQDLVEARERLLGGVADPVALLRDEELGAGLLAFDDGEEDGAFLALDHAGEPLEQRLVRSRDEDVDLASARQADRERELVGDPVAEDLRLRAGEHLAGVAEDLVLDAAAGDGADHLAPLGDGELRSDRPGSRLSRGDDRRDRDALAAAAPALDLGQDLSHAACLLCIPTRTSASSSRLARSPPETNRSRNGSAARIPPASGWYSGLPLSGFTQTTPKAARRSRAISRATRAGSSRSQPSETITTIAPRVSARRPQRSLYALSAAPIRVPAAQS